jgi:hypothetical protein
VITDVPTVLAAAAATARGEDVVADRAGVEVRQGAGPVRRARDRTGPVRVEGDGRFGVGIRLGDVDKVEEALKIDVHV